MKLTIAALSAGVLALGACDQVSKDPDIQEARTAIKGAVKDRGAALKQVRNELRETQAKDETGTAD